MTKSEILTIHKCRLLFIPGSRDSAGAADGGAGEDGSARRCASGDVAAGPAAAGAGRGQDEAATDGPAGTGGGEYWFF